MKAINRALMLLTALIMVLIASVSVNADVVGNATGYTDSKYGVNMRKSATILSGRIMIIPDNKKVTILEEQFKDRRKISNELKWYKISYDGKTGYIRADLVDGIKYPSVEAKTTDYLNFRVGAGTKMAKKGTFSKGRKVYIVGKARPRGSSELWYKIKLGKTYVYSNSSWVTFNKKTVDENKIRQAKIIETCDRFFANRYSFKYVDGSNCFYKSPESGGAIHCSGFISGVYYTALGYKTPGGTNKLNEFARNNVNNANIVALYQNSTPSLAMTLKNIKLGDTLTFSTTKSQGHTLIAYEPITDTKGNIVDYWMIHSYSTTPTINKTKLSGELRYWNKSIECSIVHFWKLGSLR